MKNLVITAVVGVSLLSSCVAPNSYVQNECGFDVDTESTAMIIASGLMDKDPSYEDELVRISDKLANMTVDGVVTVEELRKSTEDAILQYSPKSRRTKVLAAFEVLFKYYSNVAGSEGYLTEDSYAVIQSIANGIARAVEIHWLTYPEVDCTK